MPAGPPDKVQLHVESAEVALGSCVRLSVGVLDREKCPILELSGLHLRPRCSDPNVQLDVQHIRPDPRDSESFEVLLCFSGRVPSDGQVKVTLAVVKDDADGAAGDGSDGARVVCQSEAVDLRLVPGPSARLAVVSPASPHEEIGAEWRYRSGERVGLCVRAVDKWGNVDRTAGHAVELVLQPSGRGRQGEKPWCVSGRLDAGSTTLAIEWRTRCSTADLRVACSGGGHGLKLPPCKVAVERGEWPSEIRLTAPALPLIVDDEAGTSVDGVEVEVLRDDERPFSHQDLAVSLRPPAKFPGSAAPEAVAGEVVEEGRFRFGAWELPAQPGNHNFIVVARCTSQAHVPNASEHASNGRALNIEKGGTRDRISQISSHE